MKLEVNITDSIDYTKLLFNDLGRLVILAILDVIPIVNFIVMGYLWNVVKQPKKSNQLPPLENYGELWINGLKIFFASVIFMILPIILIVPFAFAAVLSAWVSVPVIASVGGLLSILLLLVGVVLAFFLAILLAMALINMIKHNNFAKAFAFGEIMEIIGKIGWGTYIVWLIVMFILSAIVSAIGSIPVIGWILSLLLAPIFGIFIARSAAITYMEAMPEETETPTTTEET